MKIAFVYDRVNKIGGAERVITALHEIWPEAPLFTAVYDKKNAGWARTFSIRPSFLSRLPFISSHHEFFPWLMPFAFESFSFDGFDVVLSITSAEAKTVITKPQTLHVCYCLTPTRYLWSGSDTYVQRPGLGGMSGAAKVGLSLMRPMLRKWDMIGSSRPDFYVAISKRVAGRIRKYYQRNVDRVMYPPLESDVFGNSPKEGNIPEYPSGSYYLLVSRLVSYKRADIVIRACSLLEKPLIVIGTGKEEKVLRKKAGKTVRFISRYLTDDELLLNYQHCRAFLFAGDEDFAIVALEAQAAGKPVIAYKQSGMGEIVRNGITGLLFNRQDERGLIDAIEQFERMDMREDECRKNALERFGKKQFQKEFKEYIETTYSLYKKNL